MGLVRVVGYERNLDLEDKQKKRAEGAALAMGENGGDIRHFILEIVVNIERKREPGNRI